MSFRATKLFKTKCWTFEQSSRPLVDRHTAAVKQKVLRSGPVVDALNQSGVIKIWANLPWAWAFREFCSAFSSVTAEHQVRRNHGLLRRAGKSVCRLHATSRLARLISYIIAEIMTRPASPRSAYRSARPQGALAPAAHPGPPIVRHSRAHPLPSRRR